MWAHCYRTNSGTYRFIYLSLSKKKENINKQSLFRYKYKHGNRELKQHAEDKST